MKEANFESLILKWFSLKKWNLLPFQKETLKYYFEGKSGLISVPTGAGKTYAAYLPALSRLHQKPGKGIHILYITPLKALAADLKLALQLPIEDLKLPYRTKHEQETHQLLSKTNRNNHHQKFYLRPLKVWPSCSPTQKLP